MATLLLLQARGRVTAAEVAAEFEISLKTARRDLEALSLAGIPVYSQPGRGGGWQFLGGGRTDLSGLTAAEARSALRKLVRALPKPFRADAAAAAAVVLDPAVWGAVPPPASPPIDALQRAVIEQVQVQLDYEDHTGAVSNRIVHPLGVVAKGGLWYALADTEAGRRTFRVSRVRAVELTELPAIRPEGFDLAAAWREIAATIDERRTRARAILQVNEDALEGLRVQFGVDFAVGKQLSERRFEVELSGASLVEIAERLAGWGKGIEVIGPEEVRRHLARIGAELVEVYGAS